MRVIPHRAQVIGNMRKAVRIPPLPAKREQTAGDGRNPIPPTAIGGAEMAGPIHPAKKSTEELVRIGLSNGGFTAIEGNVQEGQAVIIGLSSSSNSKQTTQTATPFGMQAPGGGGMGRMR